jgi:hypothetical protein
MIGIEKDDNPDRPHWSSPVGNLFGGHVHRAAKIAQHSRRAGRGADGLAAFLTLALPAIADARLDTRSS